MPDSAASPYCSRPGRRAPSVSPAKPSCCHLSVLLDCLVRGSTPVLWLNSLIFPSPP